MVCLTREELTAGRAVSREVAFAPEYLETATDEEQVSGEDLAREIERFLRDER